MKKIFTLSLILISIYSSSQTICGTAGEGGTVTLTAPAGRVFTTIVFASYGTPNGSCGSFTIGACHASNSSSICSTAVAGRNSVSIGANNGVFGDPCGGTPKRLFIEAAYAFPLPVKLVSFIAQKMDGGRVRLSWKTEMEQNSSHFVIERSTDGILFEAAGRIDAAGSSQDYSFIHSLSGASIHYYRLKMIDTDGHYEYSNIVRVDAGIPFLSLNVYPSPVTNYLTIVSSKRTEATVSNSAGQKLKEISLVIGSQTLGVAEWKPGVYFITTPEASSRFVKL